MIFEIKGILNDLEIFKLKILFVLTFQRTFKRNSIGNTSS